MFKFYLTLRWIFALVGGFIYALFSCFFSLISYGLSAALGRSRFIGKPRELWLAVQQQNKSAIQAYIAQGGDINITVQNRQTVLHHAAMHADLEVVELLIRQGANINAKDRWGLTPLFYALKNQNHSFANLLYIHRAEMGVAVAALEGDFDGVHRFLRQGARVNIKIGKGSSLLHLASQSGSVDVVNLLLNHKARVNIRDEERLTPLLLAVRYGHENVVHRLIQAGAAVNTVSKGLTPLYEAVRRGDKTISQRLLANGAWLECPGQRRPLLHVAVERGDRDLVELLLSYGAEVNRRDAFPFGNTPLHLAAVQGYVDLAGLLLAKGARVNVKNWFPGVTPLQMAEKHSAMTDLLKQHGASEEIFEAVMRGNVEVLRTYLDRGGNVNLANSAGMTLLHFAAYAGQDETIEVLLTKGAEINAKDKQGMTPLEYAAQRAAVQQHRGTAVLLMIHGAAVNLKVAALLKETTAIERYLEQGGNPNTRFRRGETLLDMAVTGGEAALVELLLNKGARVQQRKSFQLLMRTIQSQNPEICRLLIERGANVNAQIFWGPIGPSILQLAATAGQVDMVELLLSKGAKINRSNWFGSPLHGAVQSGQVETVHLLLEQGADINLKAGFMRMTPLQMAKIMEKHDPQYAKITQLLVRYGAEE